MRSVGVMLGIVCGILPWSAASQPAKAVEKATPRSSGYVETVVFWPKIHDERIALQKLRIETVGQWQVSSLLDEPIVECLLAWRIPSNQPAATAIVDGKYVSIPMDVVRKIDMYAVELTVLLKTGSPPMSLSCDVGATAAAVTDSDATWSGFRKWSDDQRQRFFSYNTPGSPDWAALFHASDGTVRWWVSKDEAKKKVAAGFEAVVLGGVSSQWGITKVQFNLAPIHEWLAEQETKKLAAAKDAIRKEDESRLAAQKKRDELPAADFWNTPEKPETTTEVKTRTARTAEVSKHEHAIAEAKNRAATQRAAHVAWRDRKIDEIKNRPAPGVDKSIVEAERRIVDLAARYPSVTWADSTYRGCSQTGNLNTLSIRRTGHCALSVKTVRKRHFAGNCEYSKPGGHETVQEIDIDLTKPGYSMNQSQSPESGIDLQGPYIVKGQYTAPHKVEQSTLVFAGTIDLTIPKEHRKANYDAWALLVQRCAQPAKKAP